MYVAHYFVAWVTLQEFNVDFELQKTAWKFGKILNSSSSQFRRFEMLISG